MWHRRCVIALALWLAPAVALADSDGYFCVGPGYIAYEKRFSFGGPLPRDWPAPVRPHELEVIRFVPETGISDPETLQLEEFQVHGMKCESTLVQIASFESVYTVDVAIRHRLRVTDRRALDVRGHIPPDLRSHANLAGGQERVVELGGDENHRFELMMADVSNRTPHGLDHYHITELINRDRDGTIRESRRLFIGIRKESAH